MKKVAQTTPIPQSNVIAFPLTRDNPPLPDDTKWTQIDLNTLLTANISGAFFLKLVDSNGNLVHMEMRNDLNETVWIIRRAA